MTMDNPLALLAVVIGSVIGLCLAKWIEHIQRGKPTEDKPMLVNWWNGNQKPTMLGNVPYLCADGSVSFDHRDIIGRANDKLDPGWPATEYDRWIQSTINLCIETASPGVDGPTNYDLACAWWSKYGNQL